MSVQVATLASSSAANCTLVATGSTKILIDAGLSRKQTLTLLERVEVKQKDITAILLTHEHPDHARSALTLAKHLRIPFYATHGTFAAMAGCDGSLFSPIERRVFMVGDIQVTPFAVPHDAADPVGFILEADDVKIGLATDLGMIPEPVQDMLATCHALILEMNHDSEMLNLSSDPALMRKRIEGKYGHLSNEAVGQFLDKYEFKNLLLFVAAHLSRRNNSRALVQSVLAQFCKPHTLFTIAGVDVVNVRL